jgi:hypothetical protein
MVRTDGNHYKHQHCIEEQPRRHPFVQDIADLLPSRHVRPFDVMRLELPIALVTGSELLVRARSRNNPARPRGATERAVEVRPPNVHDRLPSD